MAPVSAANASWNGTIAAGGTASFGFLASYPTSNSKRRRDHARGARPVTFPAGGRPAGAPRRVESERV
ncbi:cellulose binding domain-containing protein [Luedemannella flava]|uniref:cellulose binding domain-containing protein n=1 Tax=Luedemannella flava TaxID=349316 RepID=UPI00361AFFF1